MPRPFPLELSMTDGFDMIDGIDKVDMIDGIDKVDMMDMIDRYSRTTGKRVNWELGIVKGERV